MNHETHRYINHEGYPMHLDPFRFPDKKLNIWREFMQNNQSSDVYLETRNMRFAIDPKDEHDLEIMKVVFDRTLKKEQEQVDLAALEAAVKLKSESCEKCGK